jgi:hypothetical protein
MASSNDREVLEGKLWQGVDEIIAYTLDVSAVGSTPSSVGVVVKDVTNAATVTATVMPVNSPTVDGNVITLSPLKLLTNGVLYRVEVKYVISGNTLESYFYVQGQE